MQSDFEFYKERFATIMLPVADVRDIWVKSYRRKHHVTDAYKIKE